MWHTKEKENRTLVSYLHKIHVHRPRSASICYNQVEFASGLKGIKGISNLEMWEIHYYENIQFYYIYSDIYISSFEYI
jgi:hypothetical protein